MSQPSPSFKVIFDGRIRSGHDPEQVRNRLSSLFRTSAIEINRLFINAPVAVKNSLSHPDALKYQQALEQAGVHCHIENENAIPDNPPEPSPAVPSSPSPAVTLTCPKCGFAQPRGLECARCGVIFSKLATPNGPDMPADTAEPVAESDHADAESDPEWILDARQIDQEGWIALAVGLVLSGLPFTSSLLRAAMHGFITLVHEFGHSVTAWIFGYPSFPAFDFVYGGGVAIHFDREIQLLLVIYAGFGVLFYLYRHNRFTLTVLSIAAGIYTILAFTPAHEILGLFMGHGTELVFAGIFLYRAISSSGVIISIERPLYAFVAFFTIFNAIHFAYGLMNDPVARYDYRLGKGGLTHDFIRIGTDYLGVDFGTVAAFFLFCAVITPVFSFLFFRYQRRIFLVFLKLSKREPVS